MTSQDQLSQGIYKLAVVEHRKIKLPFSLLLSFGTLAELQLDSISAEGRVSSDCF